jgi:hypothetical protein
VRLIDAAAAWSPRIVSGCEESVSVPGRLNRPESLSPQLIERVDMLGHSCHGAPATVLTAAAAKLEVPWGHPGIFESDKGETIAVGIGKRDLGAVVLIALLAAVDQDAVLRHLGHERLLRVWTATARLPVDWEGQSTVQPSNRSLSASGRLPKPWSRPARWCRNGRRSSSQLYPG